jgi:large subunit ribosomal protein L14e
LYLLFVFVVDLHLVNKNKYNEVLNMINIGRVCMKIAGRDSGKFCVITEIIDDNYVMIDGQTRKRKCNLTHLEILKKSVDIKENASNKEVVEALKTLNIESLEKKEKESKEKVKPKKVKKNNKSVEEKNKVKTTKAKEAKAKKEVKVKETKVKEAKVEEENKTE